VGVGVDALSRIDTRCTCVLRRIHKVGPGVEARLTNKYSLYYMDCKFKVIRFSDRKSEGPKAEA
jgi:hypothetical protein